MDLNVEPFGLKHKGVILFSNGQSVSWDLLAHSARSATLEKKPSETCWWAEKRNEN